MEYKIDKSHSKGTLSPQKISIFLKSCIDVEW